MPVTRTISNDGKTISVVIDGKFNHELHEQFCAMYIDTPRASKAFELDLSRVTYLDSSSIGMLMLLREHAGGDTAKIRFTKMAPRIRETFMLSGMDKLFTIDPEPKRA